MNGYDWIGVVLALCMIALGLVWVGYKIRDSEGSPMKHLDDALYLSMRGWKCVAAYTSFSPIYWTAPDEPLKLRPQYEAVERQRELDRLARLNLPDEPKRVLGMWQETEYEEKSNE